MFEELIGSCEWLQARDETLKSFIMRSFQPLQDSAGFLTHDLAQQFAEEPLSAHPDSAMNLPTRNHDACGLQRI
jgi:hypothetical protein